MPNEINVSTMKYGRYGVKADAKAIPDAPRNESPTGKAQQLIGKTERNAEDTEKPLATAVREIFINSYIG